MSDLRLLEINYDTAPVLGDVALYDGSGWLPSSLLALVSAWLPPGIVVSYVNDTAPDGWIICDGQAVSRTTFAALYAVIGDTYGSGDGSTTFNVPDLQQHLVMNFIIWTGTEVGGSSSGRLMGILGLTYP
jgi:phage-related tail fiber protein